MTVLLALVLTLIAAIVIPVGPWWRMAVPLLCAYAAGAIMFERES